MQPIANGSCTLHFTGGSGKTADLPITVAVPAPTPTPTSTPSASPPPAGSSVVLYIGKLATLDSDGDLIVYDRDQSGTVQASHTINEYSAWGLSPEWQIHSKTLNGTIYYGDPGNCSEMLTGGGSGPIPSPGTVSCGALPGLVTIGMHRSDGYDFEAITLQGVRVFDPISAQWLTPDAYFGDVHDPMSQKPFMWNDNNPIEYEDPSGYCPQCAGAAAVGSAIVDGLIVLGLVGEIASSAGRPDIKQKTDAATGQILQAVKSALSDAMGSIVNFASEHTKGARPSTENQHQEGKARKAEDRPGGEKADWQPDGTGKRRPPNKRPPGAPKKGPWPPKKSEKQ